MIESCLNYKLGSSAQKVCILMMLKRVLGEIYLYTIISLMSIDPASFLFRASALQSLQPPFGIRYPVLAHVSMPLTASASSTPWIKISLVFPIPLSPVSPSSSDTFNVKAHLGVSFAVFKLAMLNEFALE